jgi:hypothetical protein
VAALSLERNDWQAREAGQASAGVKYAGKRLSGGVSVQRSWYQPNGGIESESRETGAGAGGGGGGSSDASVSLHRSLRPSTGTDQVLIGPCVVCCV